MREASCLTPLARVFSSKKQPSITRELYRPGMISGVGSVAILVNGPSKAAQWYEEKLGFEIVENEGHTVFARPKDSQLLLHLCGKSDSWGRDSPGGRTGLWLYCGEISMRKDPASGQLIPASSPEEVERTYLQLKKNGVEFSEELTSSGWGNYAILKDLDGNDFEMS